MTFPRLAAIDIGTNSLRFVVVEVEDDGSYRVLDEERAMVRLGYRLVETGKLDPQAMAAAYQAVGKMKAIADGFEVRELRAVATSAVREASNGREFRRELWRAHKVRVEVISPEEEARLAFQSAARHFKLDSRSTAIVDIGGGSVEVIFAAGSVADRVHSLRLGAVRLTERYVKSDPLKRRHWKRLRRAIDRALKEEIGRPPFAVERIIGSGGTFTTLAEMLEAERGGGGASVQGYALTRQEVGRLLYRLIETPLETRREIPGLNPRRADIMIAGAAVVTRIARFLDCRQILVNDRGIRDGLILTMIAELQGDAAAPPAPLDRMERVRVFARKCRSNERHAEQVARLAVQIYDGLVQPYGLPAEGRELLEAAALLHDIGYLISHAGHHKHAYHLILSGELPGFSAREVELLANVVRYQRRVFPSKAHANFARLAREDRRLVRVLAGILRVANGLDRTHTRRVAAVRPVVAGGRIRLLLEAGGDPSVELVDAQRRSGLMQETLGARVDIARRQLRAVAGTRRAVGA